MHRPTFGPSPPDPASGGPASGAAVDPAPVPAPGPGPGRQSRGGLRSGSVFLSFVPWIVFDVIAGPSTWKLAALTALVAALVLAVPDARHHALKVLSIVGVAFFAVLCVLGLALDRHSLIWLETYAQVLSSGVLAVVALGSLAFTPFTEQYARESTPPEVWGTPRFQRTNRLLTALWGAVFLITALLGLAALHVGSAKDWLTWVIPVILLVLAFRITRWYPEHVREQARRGR